MLYFHNSFEFNKSDGWVSVTYNNCLVLQCPDTGLSRLDYIIQAVESLKRYGVV